MLYYATQHSKPEFCYFSECTKVLMNADNYTCIECIIGMLRQVVEFHYQSLDPFEFNSLIETILSLVFYGYKVCKSTKSKLL